jgi:hypothetical protein
MPGGAAHRVPLPGGGPIAQAVGGRAEVRPPLGDPPVILGQRDAGSTAAVEYGRRRLEQAIGAVVGPGWTSSTLPVTSNRPNPLGGNRPTGTCRRTRAVPGSPTGSGRHVLAITLPRGMNLTRRTSRVAPAALRLPLGLANPPCRPAATAASSYRGRPGAVRAVQRAAWPVRVTPVGPGTHPTNGSIIQRHGTCARLEHE